ncbi:MAG: endonuclease/exonuclease/phosphatase family protein [Bradymonadaceae bacterium]
MGHLSGVGFLLILVVSTIGCSSPASTPDVTEIVVDGPEVGTDGDVGPDAGVDAPGPIFPDVELRVASYNASLYRDAAGKLIEELSDPAHEQARTIAQIVQIIRPDIVLINEFDYDAEGEAARLFRTNFLEVAQGGAEPLNYPYVYAAPSNTGVHSGFDLDKNGEVVSTPGTQSYGNDAFGFGIFEGQYGFVIFSMYPLGNEGLRTFQKFLWKDMPDHMIPDDWYSDEALEVFRLSSKNHVDLPVQVGDHILHVLASHPTPPAFDGPERRNVRRNNDEIRFWNDYISPGVSDYIIDDSAGAGGLDAEAFFVIVGDLNNDPFDGDGYDSINDLLENSRTNDSMPASEGAVEKAERDGQINTQHRGDPKHNTADFSDHSVGNIRVDYALPSSNVEVLDSGVFWPLADDPHYALTTVSDHHLVWVDLKLSR